MFVPQQDPDPDASVRQTDNDAALAKLSAVNKGYLTDPFVKHFVPRAHLQPSRPPLINIGTFVRTVAIDDLVHQWIDTATGDATRCQILSLGAGSDTRFWRLSVCLFLTTPGTWLTTRVDRQVMTKLPPTLSLISPKLQLRKLWQFIRTRNYTHCCGM